MSNLRLLQLRKENHMTQDELCKILLDRFNYEVNKSLISRYEKGKHEPNFYFVDIVSTVFGVTTDYMMGRSENRYPADTKQRKIPVLYSASQEPYMVSEEISEYEYTDSDSDFCFRVGDDSMTGARIHKDDIVYIHKQKEIESGKIAAVMIDNEGLTLRRVLNVNSNSLLLHPENPSYKDTVCTKKDFKQIVIGEARYFKAEVK